MKSILTAFFCLMFLTEVATAAPTLNEAAEGCKEALASTGVEMSINPIEVHGSPWVITWNSGAQDDLAGERIVVRFPSGNTEINRGEISDFLMADHLMTIESVRERGAELIGAKYPDGKIAMVYPVITELFDDGKGYMCFGLVLVHPSK